MPPESAELAVEPALVEKAGDALEAVGDALVVREPPWHADPARVGVDVLHARQLVQPVLRVRRPVAGLLPAAPRRLARAVGVGDVVRPDHPGLDPSSDPARADEVARPDARSEA